MTAMVTGSAEGQSFAHLMGASLCARCWEVIDAAHNFFEELTVCARWPDRRALCVRFLEGREMAHVRSVNAWRSAVSELCVPRSPRSALPRCGAVRELGSVFTCSAGTARGRRVGRKVRPLGDRVGRAPIEPAIIVHVSTSRLHLRSTSFYTHSYTGPLALGTHEERNEREYWMILQLGRCSVSQVPAVLDPRISNPRQHSWDSTRRP